MHARLDERFNRRNQRAGLLAWGLAAALCFGCRPGGLHSGRDAATPSDGSTTPLDAAPPPSPHDGRADSGPLPTTQSCDDGVKNGTESDVDCGGDCPRRCALGQACRAGADCQSTFCENLVCAVGTSTILFISPQGDDGNDGLSAAAPLGTFDAAWPKLHPGDTLILMDGTYTPTTTGVVHPKVRNGEPGKPITIRAQHDGKAVIDGQHQVTPVSMRDQGNGWQIGDYFAIEGIVAKNSSQSVYQIAGNHNVLRRISGYHANTDENEHVITVTGGNNLLEDCVASGTGRKAFLLYGNKNEQNTVRRCFAAWHFFRGLNWPGNDFVGIQIYGGKDNIIENSIAASMAQVNSYEHADFTGISVMANDPSLQAVGNRVLGSIAYDTGMRYDGSPLITEEAASSNCWGYCRSGFNLHGNQSQVTDNTYQDSLAFHNGGPGLGRLNVDANFARNKLVRITLVGNGVGQPPNTEGAGVNVLDKALAQYDTKEDCWIDGRSEAEFQGQGAKLAKRYIDGAATSDSLWPWPMEDRIKSELSQEFGVAGYSVTCKVGTVINDLFAQGKVAEQIDPAIVAAARSK